MLTTMLDALIDLVLPRCCLGCARAGAPLCASCVPVCDPFLAGVGAVPVLAAARYDAAIRVALLAYKERGRRDLARPLATLLAASVHAALRAPPRAPRGTVVLVPVPSQRSAIASRGGDHVLRLARRVSAETGTRVVVDALSLTRAVRDSAGLGIRARADNLHGAMQARPAPSGVTAVLVDDIVTTGATIAECARALHGQGWPLVGAAVVAATPRHAQAH